jgi:hypothetical protein
MFANNLSRNYSINKQNVLEHPQNYLGPNYKELLNFWYYWDSLSYKQWYACDYSYLKLDVKTYNQAVKISKKLASEVIDPRITGWLKSEVCEIIAAHLFIQHNIPFTFLPLLFDL